MFLGKDWIQRGFGTPLLELALGLALSAPWLSGCDSAKRKGSDDAITSAEIALTEVPENVHCIRITAAGARAVVDNFGVVPDQRSVFRMNHLPVGAVRFYGEAFPGDCDNLDTGETPSWIGGPELVDVIPGAANRVTLSLRPNSRAVVAVDFEEQPDGDEPCVGEEPGCVSPEDASGSVDDPLPEGATMVSPAEFAEGLSQGTLVLTSPRIQEELAEQRAADDERHLRELTARLADQPEVLERLLREPEESEYLRRLPGGNYELTLEPDETGEVQTVMTLGQRFAIAEANRSLERFGTRDNQLGVYQNFYNVLPDEYRQEAGLPSPDEVGELSADHLWALNDGIGIDWETIMEFIDLMDLPPPGYPSSCADEEGAPTAMLDQSGSCTPSPTGIWSQYAFPLKWYATCVKHQGNRGTCPAFGITGAVEALVAKTQNRWLNLSEQKLYYFGKVPVAYDDGLHTANLALDMFMGGFTFPWEHEWDYNASWDRVDLGFAYANSCVGYGGEHCSDAAHQGDLLCTGLAPFQFCAWDGSTADGSGVHVSSSYAISAPGTGVAWAVTMLVAGHPLVLSYRVTVGFKNSADGIVVYDPLDVSYVGNHASVVVGFIANGDLSAGTPAADGGGYFIVKNSWGTCAHDGGYVYLPVSWINDHGISFLSISGIY